jgi:hypothetical protein
MSATKPARGTRDHLAWLIDWVRRCAEDLKQPVHRLRHRDFLEWALAEEGGPSARPSRGDVDAYAGSEGRGAWPNIIAYAADEGGDYEEPDRAQLGMVREIVKTNQHRRKLERLVGDEERFAERLERSLAVAIERNPPSITKLRGAKLATDKPAAREVVAHLSDVHIGIDVDEREVLGGRFNYQIAARRVGLFANQIVSYKSDKRGDAALRLVMNGDLIESTMHGDDNGIDLLTNQIDAAQQIYTSFLDYIRAHGGFSHIHVMCSGGNHDRMWWKGTGRPTAQKFDSIATLLFRGLQAIFRNAPDITFHIPRTPFSLWQTCGWKYYATHGDSCFTIGMPSKSIQLDKLYGKLWALESNAAIGGRVDCLMLGHMHFPSIFRVPGRSPYAWLNINGSVSGRNAYTQHMGFAASPPSQCMWEATTDHAVGDFRIVDLEVADDDARLDSVIRTPMPIGGDAPVYAIG